MKVIFHIDELNKWELLLNNVSNLIKVEDTFQIEVLANSEAVRYYLFENQKIKNLQVYGVEFTACHNSLKGNQINPSSLIEGIEIVPVGVYELAIKQQEGYAYIKP